MPNVEEAVFDRVHDTQFMYRQLLDALARPGRIGSIAEPGCKLALPGSGLNMAAALAITLLDGEVGFAVCGCSCAGGEAVITELEDYIRRHTFSKTATVEDADYVFACGCLPDDDIHAVMEIVHRGSLTAPERGATLFMQVDFLAAADVDGSVGPAGEEAEGSIWPEPAVAASEGGAGLRPAEKGADGVWLLQGPGIRGSRRLTIGGMSQVWFDERAKANAEYPMGIDMILFTADGQLAALPRTTLIRKERA
ncbi:phosphonate C-P lyase system protein PhnH [Paenibacillus piri]|uniref:Phosphonate C-P lyase system protein PhnH n=1 Tax=Paenibacillus piri TaxID=2547395 RepID=A0A4R5KWY6_9BACL|nr:phosphonate C-P lyase system protein PhnH [Paenibacillus piri]TDG00562.1 phosphonate C-P lyase system protein PhnH [Paenibacillus piri]